MPGLDEHDATSLHGCTVYPEHVHRRHRHRRHLDRSCCRASPATRRSSPSTCSGRRRSPTAGFDPSEIVDFVELVARQDYDVCERVQRGVRSRAFTHGVLAEKDALVENFDERYLHDRDG